PGLPPAYVALVDHTLDRDPARRPASASVVQEALTAIARPPVRRRPRVWPWLTAAIGAALVGLSMWQLGFFAAGVRSIGVLPIRNLTGDPSKGYVAEGLTEVLISNLARIR